MTDAIAMGASALQAGETWLAAGAANVANMNDNATTTSYAEQQTVLTAAAGGVVATVTSVSPPAGAYSLASVYAARMGVSVGNNVDAVDSIAQLIEAGDYEAANLAVMRQAVQMYKGISALPASGG